MRLPRPSTVRPPRRHTWDRRRYVAPASPPPPPAPVTVTAVTALSGGRVGWHFSADPVTIPDDCPQLEISADGAAWIVPLVLESGDTPDAVNAVYTGPSPAAGWQYRLRSAPDGLAFPDAAPVAVPESGTITG